MVSFMHAYVLNHFYQLMRRTVVTCSGKNVTLNQISILVWTALPLRNTSSPWCTVCQGTWQVRCAKHLGEHARISLCVYSVSVLSVFSCNPHSLHNVEFRALWGAIISVAGLLVSSCGWRWFFMTDWLYVWVRCHAAERGWAVRLKDISWSF